MDQHGADSSQPDSGSARPNFHSPAASSVSLYQPADLPRDRHPCPPGSTGMAGKSGPSLRYHHLNQAVLIAKGRRHARYTAKKYLGFINCLFVGEKLRNNKLVNLYCLSTWDCVSLTHTSKGGKAWVCLEDLAWPQNPEPVCKSGSYQKRFISLPSF